MVAKNSAANADADVATGGENDAAAAPVVGGDTGIAGDPAAAETGGAKLLRCRHGDSLHDSEGTVIVDGTWRHFPANKAKAALELAAANNVRLAVADPPKEG